MKSDVELTRRIRRAVVKDSSLSVMAHNVKIVSANGSVTLRGPVKTEAEKDAIASKAQSIAGADRVNNELEVRISINSSRRIYGRESGIWYREE